MRVFTVVLVAVATAAVPAELPGQLIALRTVPVAAGDQFLIFPSDNLALGGARIALDDPLFDPFVNPAKGARVAGSRVFAAPTFYSISQNAGSAGTLSLGGVFGGGRLFGTSVVALQQLKSGQEFFGPMPLAETALVPPDALSRRSATNKYGQLSIGTRVGGSAAIGIGGTFADLGAIDGVEHLYAMSADIAQSGSVVDLRAGAMGETSHGGLVEAVLVYNHFSARHDVTYVDWVVVDSTNWIWEPRERRELNRDKTDTWGGHVGFRRPLGSRGWRVGGAVTANYKSHPSIPNYELVNIPRDPGHTTALDIGVGIAREVAAVTVGLDVVYEPGWSSTWAEAADQTVTMAGDTIPAGGRTVENEFRFSNARVHLGVGYAVGPASFALGLQVHANDYHLDQWNNVTGEARRQDEQWMEWVPSWGVRLRLTGVELRYVGRVTTGTGRPGVAWNGTVAERAADAAFANDIVVPPGGPLTLQEVDVWTHQISVAIPIN